MPVVRGFCGGRSSGARWWCLGGLWTERRGVFRVLSRLVHLWVMYGMVMGEMQHVIPCGGVAELLPVC